MYKMIRKDLPKLPLLYFSDSGEVPYGKLSKKKLRSRVEKVFKFLKDAGAEQIVVACHSASSVVIDSDGVISLRTPTVKAVLKRKAKRVGIIGGGRTIRSGYYRRELNKAGIKTNQRIAQQLSILVERGEVDTPAVEAAVAKIMKPLRRSDSVLLACTHYPVLSKAILKHVPGVIDPVDELYKSIRRHLDETLTGPDKFLTTGDVKLMRSAAQKAFGVTISTITKVTF